MGKDVFPVVASLPYVGDAVMLVHSNEMTFCLHLWKLRPTGMDPADLMPVFNLHVTQEAHF